MSEEIYRKHGRSLRLERAASERALVAVVESGEAERREDLLFSCRTLPAQIPLPEIDETPIIAAEGAIVALLEEPLSLERLIITSGVALHERQSEAGARTWNAASFRIHASIVNRSAGFRILWEEAQAGVSGFGELARATSALASIQRPAEKPRLVQLSRPVAAPLWPALLLMLGSQRKQQEPAHEGQERPAGLRLGQSAEGGYGLDGNGEPIATATLYDGARILFDRWPNAFRPTYRHPAQPMPMNVTAALDRSGAVVPDALAVAVLEPPSFDGQALTIGVLLVDGDRRASPMRVRMTPSEWCRAVVAVEGEERWYPHGAGSFGREVTIDISRGSDSSDPGVDRGIAAEHGILEFRPD
jgi:hypothetical protein